LKDYKINKEILIKNLDLIKDYETYNNEVYKVRAYTNAINNIIINNHDMKIIEDVYNLENIGDKIMEKIFELYLTGKISYIENIIKDDAEYHFKLELLEIHGIGPKNAKKIIDAGIKTIADLKKNTKLLNNKQKIGLKYYDDLKLKIPLAEYKKHLSILKKDLKDITYDFTGSYRRGSKVMGDIDVLIMENPKFKLNDYIAKLHNSKYIINYPENLQDALISSLPLKMNTTIHYYISLVPIFLILGCDIMQKQNLIYLLANMDF